MSEARATVQLQSPITPLSQTAMCCAHEDQPLSIYCVSCKLLVCLDCLDDGHEDHFTTSAKKQFSFLKKEVATLVFSVLEHTKQRKDALNTVTDQITKEGEEYTVELQKRLTQQKDAVAQLDAQFQQLIADAEGIYKKKRSALMELMTKSYQDNTEGRIKALQEASRTIEAECSELEDTTSAFHSRLTSASGTTSTGIGEPTLQALETDCEALTMVDVADLMPKLQKAVTSRFSSLPEAKSSPTELTVPARMKNYYVKLNTALETLHERADELLSITGFGAVVNSSFYSECQLVVLNHSQHFPRYRQVADPDKAYDTNSLSLLTISEKAGKELAQLFGGEHVLVRERRNNKEVLRTTTGTVTHVRAGVHKIWKGYWLPANVYVEEAVRLAGFRFSRLFDSRSKREVTFTNTLTWFDSSSDCLLIPKI